MAAEATTTMQEPFNRLVWLAYAGASLHQHRAQVTVDAEHLARALGLRFEPPAGSAKATATSGDEPTTATKHTCGGPVFGRLAPPGECVRCDELRAGAPPVRWRNARRDDGARRSAEIHAHFRSRRHNDPTDPNYCGPVCTFGEW
jgi:hypothetical protein